LAKDDDVGRQTVSGCFDQQKLWGICRIYEFYVVTHLPSGRAVTRCGGGAGNSFGAAVLRRDQRIYRLAQRRSREDRRCPAGVIIYCF
jgi:hypothetical protein